MTSAVNTPAAAEPMRLLRERCLALGLPTLRIDTDGEPLADPMDFGVAGRVLGSRFVQRLLFSAAHRWATTPDPQPTELAPGLWAIPSPEWRRRRCVGFLVAFYLCPNALHGAQFIAACRSAEIDERAAAAALSGFAVHASDGVARAAATVRLLHDDVNAKIVSNDSLATFSKQLSESYEEVSFLYKLGASMNQIVQPDRFVRLVCQELHAMLAFRWVGVAFAGKPEDGRALAGRTFFAGPADVSLLRPALERIVRLSEPAKERVIPLGELGPEAGRSTGEAVVQPVARDGRLLGVIVAGDKGGDDPHVSSVDMKLIAAAGSYLAIHLENAALYEDQQSMFLGTLKALTASIDAKDRYTRGHSERVAHLTRELGARAGLNEQELERVHIAGLVHDVGKIGVPEAVLRKPGALTDAEFALIKLHPEIGHTILKDIPQLADVLPGVLHHHERWDGRGYPHKIAGEAIPFVARLIALADSFDAMSSTRTYRPAMPRDRVLAEIHKGAGAQFDPDLAREFVNIDFAQFDRMVVRHVAQESEGGAALGAAA